MNKASSVTEKYLHDPTRRVQYPVSDDFVPKRLGLSIDPPMLILEYIVPNTGRLYHHKVRLQSRMEQTLKTEELLAFVKTKHQPYFRNGKISDQQITNMINKILEHYEFDEEDSKRTPLQIQNNQNDPAWDFNSDGDAGFDIV